MIPRTNLGDCQTWTLFHDGTVHVAPEGDPGDRVHTGEVRRADLHPLLLSHYPGRALCSGTAPVTFHVVHKAPHPDITWATGATLREEPYRIACRIMAEAFGIARRSA